MTPAAGADPATTRLFLLGSAWGALLTQRGAFAFHAGVVATRAGTVAFCGPSGAGKSTLVSAVLAAGGELVSDDLTRLEVIDDGPPVVWPSTPQLRLTASSLEHTPLIPGSGEPSPLDGKRRVSWRGPRVDGPRRLAAICILAWGADDLRRLRGAAAVQQLMSAATYRPGLFDSGPAMTAHWRQCVEIARRVPIIELSRPQDWSRFAAPDIEAMIARAG